jgi:hypothetical protein
MEHPPMEDPPMEHPPASESKRRLGKAALVLAILVGCSAVLFGLGMLFASTESPTDGPLLLVLMLALLAAPVYIAAVLIHRILGSGHARDDNGFLP